MISIVLVKMLKMKTANSTKEAFIRDEQVVFDANGVRVRIWTTS